MMRIGLWPETTRVDSRNHPKLRRARETHTHTQNCNNLLRPETGPFVVAKKKTKKNRAFRNRVTMLTAEHLSGTESASGPHYRL
jgi:hypothetical protein